MRYTSSERMIANILSRFPKVKLKIKKIYQVANYVKYKKKYVFKSSFNIKKITENGETFFGYYDKSPINHSNNYIIFHKTNYPTTNIPSPENPVDIILFDVKKNTSTIVGKSSAYNWQQGSKLMWLNSDKFIYNDYNKENKSYNSVIYTVSAGESSQIDFPIYDCYEDKFALSLSFERLFALRPDYGYRNKKISVDLLNNECDGIFFIDLVANKKKLLISLFDVINIHRKKTMEGAKHKFNHISIAPDGQSFMFLHRWFVGDRKFDSLIVSDINAQNIRCLSDDDMVSHCCWYGNNSIFGYLRDSNKGDRYYKIDAVTGEKNSIGAGVIDCFGDGHPHIYGDTVVYDTYPNKSRTKELYLYNFSTKSIIKIGEFYESFNYKGETRCDLHPRFSYDGNTIFIDSVHDNSRALYMIDLGATDG